MALHRCKERGARMVVASWNVLCPLYKRIDEGRREADLGEQGWQQRNQAIIKQLLSSSGDRSQPDVVCLQEYWVGGPPAYRSLYEDQLAAAGYEVVVLPRSEIWGTPRLDGLLTAVRTSGQGARSSVVDARPIVFNDCGDRVAQLVLLRVHEQGTQKGGDVILLHTHLLFPHNAASTVIRLRETHKMLQFVQTYLDARRVPNASIILCGDHNGTPQGSVCSFLRSRGFRSAFELARGQEAQVRSVTHLDHNKCEKCVDFIHVRNSGKQHGSLLADWRSAYYYIIAAKLKERGVTSQSTAFAYFSSVSEAIGEQAISIDDFGRAICELGMTGEGTVGLTAPEIAELHSSLFQAQAFSEHPAAIGPDSSCLEGCDSAKRQETCDLNTSPGAGAHFKTKVDVEAFDCIYTRIAGEMGIAEKPWHPSLLIAAAGMLPFHQVSEGLGISASDVSDTFTDVASNEPEPRDDNSHDLVKECFHSIECSEAWLEPSTMENGAWDHSWDLSDHALVAAELELF